jgi:hypothetical protein
VVDFVLHVVRQTDLPSFSALMIGSWANSSLYILELMSAYRYFEKYEDDPIYIKLTIALCLAVDTVSVAANYGGVYLVRPRTFRLAYMLANHPHPVFGCSLGFVQYISS